MSSASGDESMPSARKTDEDENLPQVTPTAVIPSADSNQKETISVAQEAVGVQPERLSPPTVVDHTTSSSTLGKLAPTAPPSANNAKTSSFANASLRPPGERYGESDLRPGGGGVGGPNLNSGGMLLTEHNFRAQYGAPNQAGRDPSQPYDIARDYARYDPMFPGAGRVGRGGGARGQVFPGEPDPDLLMPPQGGPYDPFGGPGRGHFGPGGGGGFGGPGPFY